MLTMLSDMSAFIRTSVMNSDQASESAYVISNDGMLRSDIPSCSVSPATSTLPSPALTLPEMLLQV